jgi:VCBS repeat-containing protein
MNNQKTSPAPVNRYCRLGLAAILGLLITAVGGAIEIPTTPVGDAGNTPDLATGLGAVDYAYRMGVYEVTNQEYTAFLNAVAKADAYGLYNAGMAITRTGAAGSYAYATTAGNKPVALVSWYDALRFANWLHNEQPTGPQNSATTEDGAYAFTGPATVGDRKPGARFFLPSEDEWYKAAYYKSGALAAGYWNYPTPNGTLPTAALPPGTVSANYKLIAGQVLAVGSYVTTNSPYGTYDQAGNVWEWVETAIGQERGLRGGSYEDYDLLLEAAYQDAQKPASELAMVGFRVAAANSGGTTPVNHPPAAVNDTYSLAGNTTLTVAVPGLLGNDTDADGNALTAVKVTDPAHGTLALLATGAFTYTPAANYSGSDSFTYKANDGTADSPAATVSITVTGYPVPAMAGLAPASVTAGAASFTLTVNGSGFIAASKVLWNGAARTTQFVSATQLTAAIPAADVATAGAAAVTVATPAPGGGTSAAATVTIAPAPVVKSALKVTATVARTSRGYLVALKISNTGTTTVTAVRVTAAPFGGIAPTTELPRSYGTIKPGRSVQKTLTFSKQVGAHEQTKTLMVKVTYSGGELSQTFSLKLP